jgi:hypothetical protein
MKSFLKSFVTISVLSTLVITPFVLPGIASADQANRGTKANYVGGGFAAGVTNGGQKGDAATFGGNITGRIAAPTLPVSARGTILFSDETAAIIPEVSADLPIAKNTNLYGTLGYSFVEKNGRPTPIGNQNAVVVGAGVESRVARNFTVYSNAKLGINAYKNSPAQAFTVNGGVGINF